LLNTIPVTLTDFWIARCLLPDEMLIEYVPFPTSYLSTGNMTGLWPKGWTTKQLTTDGNPSRALPLPPMLQSDLRDDNLGIPEAPSEARWNARIAEWKLLPVTNDRGEDANIHTPGQYACQPMAYAFDPLINTPLYNSVLNSSLNLIPETTTLGQRVFHLISGNQFVEMSNKLMGTRFFAPRSFLYSNRLAGPEILVAHVSSDSTLSYWRNRLGSANPVTADDASIAASSSGSGPVITNEHAVVTVGNPPAAAAPPVAAPPGHAAEAEGPNEL
jgi:hypothetical protein